eukprot:Skav202928  [mRNA]  locus=scaffold1565:340874:341494:- [translate_table: standard]
MHQMGDMPSHNANETSLFGRLPNLLNGTKRVEKNVDKLSLAEEGLKDEDSEGSEQEQSQEYTFCNMDFKPALPAALAISTMLGGVCMFLVQIPMLARFTVLPQLALSAGFAAVFVSTLVCMAYSYFADPGQIQEPHKEALPLRAHKSWQYPLPIRRYDHYCKWLDNVIGFLNHREFVLMVGGLVMIAIIGIAVDCCPHRQEGHLGK